MTDLRDTTVRPAFLLTGFGPFPGVPINISAKFAEHLAELSGHAFPDIKFVAAKLPTLWCEAPGNLDKLYRTHRPMFALHFGVSHLARSITVECIAQNRAMHADADGHEPETDKLLADGPAVCCATVPAGALVDRLTQRSIPAVLSQDAGHYLCNAIFYYSLRAMNDLKIHGQCGFIHLPADMPPRGSDEEYDARSQNLPFETALEGGLELIATLLQKPNAETV